MLNSGIEWGRLKILLSLEMQWKSMQYLCSIRGMQIKMEISIMSITLKFQFEIHAMIGLVIYRAKVGGVYGKDISPSMISDNKIIEESLDIMHYALQIKDSKNLYQNHLEKQDNLIKKNEYR